MSQAPHCCWRGSWRWERETWSQNAANNGFEQILAIESKPPPGRRRIQIAKSRLHLKQSGAARTDTDLVDPY